MNRNRGALLISCYELGHQPLGLASPMAFLAREGIEASAIDIAVQPLDEQMVRDARLVAISVPMHTALRLGIRIARRVRDLNPTCHICFYGLYASLNSSFLLANVADSVMGGEYEQSLVALLKALTGNGRRLGAGIGQPGAPAAPVLSRLSFPVPLRRDLPPLRKYAHLERGGSFGLVGYVEASRGCLHHCLHCPIPPVYQGRYFVIPQETVLQDVRQLVASGATHITFGDPDFLNGPGHSSKIVDKMHQEFPELTFDFTAKVEHILKHRAHLSRLAELGCAFVVSAVESLSDRVLNELNKGHTRNDVFEAIALLRQAGMTLRPTWVSFTPWTTLEDYLEVLDWVDDERLVYHVDPVQYTVRLLVPPGSLLLNRPGIQPFLGPLVADSFSYTWHHPDPRMDALQLQASKLAEDAASAGEDPAEIFERVRALAWSQAGTYQPPPMRPVEAASQRRPPRLTEPWFC
jgi:radical SAM superfamily enzyme YgiQ (UPF0313 family)